MTSIEDMKSPFGVYSWPVLTHWPSDRSWYYYSIVFQYSVLLTIRSIDVLWLCCILLLFITPPEKPFVILLVVLAGSGRILIGNSIGLTIGIYWYCDTVLFWYLKPGGNVFEESIIPPYFANDWLMMTVVALFILDTVIRTVLWTWPWWWYYYSVLWWLFNDYCLLFSILMCVLLFFVILLPSMIVFGKWLTWRGYC